MSASPAPSLTRRLWRISVRLWVAQAVVLCLAAGTMRFVQGWLYVALQVATMTAGNLFLMHNDPALLERRLTIEETGETEEQQRRIIAMLRMLALAILVVAGLDHRFGWSAVPPAVVAAASVVYCVGAAVIILVFRENTFASSIIEVAADQRIVSTGPYRLVRHPMYSGTLLLGLAAPLVLGSYVAALTIVPTIVLLGARILHEERFLSERLEGYAAYLQRTRARLVPGVW
jgi:protein-S-isoprenylcysteine O-methyltransferase Ste14